MVVVGCEGGRTGVCGVVGAVHSPAPPSLHPSLPLLLHPHSLNSTHQLGGVLCCCSAAAATPTLQPLLFNTLQVRSALGSTHRRKLSFKNVSNVVVQLLHSIKYSMEVPFSNMAIPPQEKSTSITKKVRQPPGVWTSLWAVRHSLCSCSPHVNLDVGVCLFQLLPVELCSLL